MRCPGCRGEKLYRMGRDRKGVQKWKCRVCERHFRDVGDQVRPPVAMEMPTERRRGGYLDDVSWVLENCELKGKALAMAKRSASGVSLTLLQAVVKDPMFKRTFLNQMVPRLFLNEKKLEEEQGKKRSMEVLYEVIDGALLKARREAGL